MNIRDYWIIVRKRWTLILAVTLFAFAAGLTVNLVATPMYSSTSKVFVSAQGTENASDLLQGSSFTQQRVKSYSDIVTDPTVLDPVIKELALEELADLLPDRISTNVPLNTVLIEITVSDESPYRAANIANALAVSLTKVVNQLETPDGSDVSPVKISQVQNGQIQDSPESPRPLMNIALALFIGLATGFGAAILRESLDLRVRNGNDIEELGKAGILGGIAFDEDAVNNPLIVHTKPKSTRAEAFRQLRTNIQFIEAAEGRKSIIVSSSIPGEGKSTTIVNLAIAMADAGSKVLLIDCDLRKPKIHKYLGLEGAVGLTSVIIGQAKLQDAIQPWGKHKLDVLPAGQVPPNPSEILGSPAMQKLLDKFEKAYDVVLIDTAPLLPVTDAAILSKMTGGVVVVVSVGKTTRPQLQGAMNHIETVGGKVLGFVMNKIPTKGADAYGYYSYGYKYGYKYGYQYGYGTYGAAYGEEEPTKTKRPKFLKPKAKS
jgi:succinoglycan biosynthesis transport protein ExoP